ncbi:MAG: deoxyribodipyrimidine photo-lyase [Orrella sp.]
MTTCVWFRRDLRLHDQPALAAACESGPALALFVVSPTQWEEHQEAPVKLDLWRRALINLQPALADRGVALKLLRVEQWIDLPDALLAFCQQHNITEIHCNREQGVHERRRDRACYTLLKSAGIAMIAHNGQTLLEPGSLKTGSGGVYRVFSPFARACRARLRAEPLSLTPIPKPQPLPANWTPDPIDAVWPEALPSLAQLWPVDRASIEQRLSDFLKKNIHDYETARNFPADPGTSKLSPYLTSGLLSPAECLNAALALNQGELETGQEGIRSWINELIWREFYWHLLNGFPKLSMHQPLRAETSAVQWRDAPEDFEAWCEGRTGIPLVDAAMRQLLETGWMHNRLRMVVAMFLTKNLLIDWRHGEAFFMRHLIDGELAANNGGWQWSASTGADSAPYFRVFNPISQSQKFDAEGTFIRHWLPALSGLDNKSIHDPSTVQRQSLGYPAAIVDLKSSRVRAIEAFKRLTQ